ncbi:MAG: PC4/YdbC family ssDNA-binding protein [Gallionellaceae bacterium]|nr:PC4/YdbC family ssDNA-binding protein [Gallionellaceae bacterium]
MSPSDTLLLIGKYPLKVTLTAHRGRVVVDLRFQYLSAADNRLKPTRRGIALPAAALPEIISALEAIKGQMVRNGYMEPSGDGSPPKIHSHVYPPDF